MTTYPQEYVLANTFSGVHADSVNQIRVSPDGRYFASASEDEPVAEYLLMLGSVSWVITCALQYINYAMFCIHCMFILQSRF
jgi:WD40 repeat protein